MSAKEDSSSSSPAKKTAKKKHYPFGTPSHVSHPYSQFAHLPSENRDFALALATATDIKPEVIEEEPKATQQRRRIVAVPPKKKKKKSKNKNKSTGGGGDTDGEEEEEEDEDEEDEPEDDLTGASFGLQPCTKLACQLVIRTLQDIQYRNQIEKMDIEDEFERLSQDLQIAETEVHQSEEKLGKLTDLGNNLEISLTQITSKVEHLEKTKEALNTERTDINTKLMLLEVELQKANRRLEKAQKELTNARWKKKKAMQQQDADAGISFPASQISESRIIQKDTPFVQKMQGVFETEKNQLARERVVDIIERPPTVQTVPIFLQEKYFHNDEQHKDAKLDKYALKHTRGLLQDSLQSWQRMEGTLIAAAVDPFRPISPSTVLSPSRSFTASDAKSRSNHSPGRTKMTHTSSAPSLYAASSLLNTQQGSPSIRLSVNPNVNSTKFANINREQKREKTSNLLLSIHTLIEHSQVNRALSPSTTLSRSLSQSSLNEFGLKDINTAQSSMWTSKTMKRKEKDRPRQLAPLSSSRERQRAQNASLALGGDLDSEDEQQNELLETFAGKLMDDGIDVEKAFRKFTTQQFDESLSSPAVPKKKLDSVFFKNHQQEQWGRDDKVGAIRTRELDDSQLLPTGKREGSRKNEDGDGDRRLKSSASINRNGVMLLDTRKLPKVVSRTLTIKHPGMSCFDEADVLG